MSKLNKNNSLRDKKDAATFLFLESLSFPRLIKSLVTLELAPNWHHSLSRPELSTQKGPLLLECINVLAGGNEPRVANDLWDLANLQDENSWLPSAIVSDNQSMFELAFKNCWWTLIDHWVNNSLIGDDHLNLVSSNDNIKLLSLDDKWYKSFTNFKHNSCLNSNIIENLKTYRDDNRWLASVNIYEMYKQRDDAKLTWSQADVIRLFSLIISHQPKNNKDIAIYETLFSNYKQYLFQNPNKRPLSDMLDAKHWKEMFFTNPKSMGKVAKFIEAACANLLDGNTKKEIERWKDFFSSIDIPLKWIEKEVDFYKGKKIDLLDTHWLTFLAQLIRKDAKEEPSLHYLTYLHKINNLISTQKTLNLDTEDIALHRTFKDINNKWSYQCILESESIEGDFLEFNLISRDIIHCISAMTPHELEQGWEDIAKCIYSFKDLSDTKPGMCDALKVLTNYLWVKIQRQKEDDQRLVLTQLLWMCIATNKDDIVSSANRVYSIKDTASKNPRIDIFKPFLNYEIFKEAFDDLDLSKIKNPEHQAFLSKFILQQSLNESIQSKTLISRFRKI